MMPFLSSAPSEYQLPLLGDDSVGDPALQPTTTSVRSRGTSPMSCACAAPAMPAASSAPTTDAIIRPFKCIGFLTPGGTIMLKAHRAMESITLDREVLALKDDLMPRYARMIYNGYWFSPERKLLQSLIDESQQPVNGKVRIKLYKGTVMVAGRSSKSDSLFDETIATFEDDKGAYNQADAAGFIRLNALRMRIAARRRRK